jgi:hypothetical protein
MRSRVVTAILKAGRRNTASCNLYGTFHLSQSSFTTGLLLSLPTENRLNEDHEIVGSDGPALDVRILKHSFKATFLTLPRSSAPFCLLCLIRKLMACRLGADEKDNRSIDRKFTKPSNALPSEVMDAAVTGKDFSTSQRSLALYVAIQMLARCETSGK